MLGHLALNRRFAKRIAAGFTLGAALLLLAGVGTARADDYTKCQDKLRSAQSKLFQDINRHGQYSHQAQSDRNRLNDAQNWCSNHHVYGDQSRNFRNGRRYPDRDRDSYNRQGYAYRNPRNNGPYGPYR